MARVLTLQDILDHQERWGTTKEVFPSSKWKGLGRIISGKPWIEHSTEERIAELFKEDPLMTVDLVTDRTRFVIASINNGELQYVHARLQAGMGRDQIHDTNVEPLLYGEAERIDSKDLGTRKSIIFTESCEPGFYGHIRTFLSIAHRTGRRGYVEVSKATVGSEKRLFCAEYKMNDRNLQAV